MCGRSTDLSLVELGMHALHKLLCCMVVYISVTLAVPAVLVRTGLPSLFD